MLHIVVRRRVDGREWSEIRLVEYAENVWSVVRSLVVAFIDEINCFDHMELKQFIPCG